MEDSEKVIGMMMIGCFVVVVCILCYVATRPPSAREVYVGELVDVRYSGDGGSNSSTTFLFENGSVVPVRGIKRGLAVGDTVILIVRGTKLSELVINPESLEDMVEEMLN